MLRFLGINSNIVKNDDFVRVSEVNQDQSESNSAPIFENLAKENANIISKTSIFHDLQRKERGKEKENENETEKVEVSVSDSLEDSVSESDVSAFSAINLSDPALWPKPLNSKFIDHLIMCGPQKFQMKYYPKDENGRHFSNFHFVKVLSNGEEIPRRWLLYSETKDSLFCFCCFCFDRNSRTSFKSGFRDWYHLSESIKSHENSCAHIKNYQCWLEAESRLKGQTSIDKLEQIVIKKESERWCEVLNRLMNIILYLTENNSAFRGSSDKLYTDNNGKYLGLIELIAKFDPVMRDHVDRILRKEIKDHYCGKNIANELIDIMASEVNLSIISSIRDCKYFSIIADCTPDISHTEQLSVTI